MNVQLLIVLVPSAIRDDMIDALIQHDDISGFNLWEINGYSQEHSRYSLGEQVAGYRKLHRFEIQHLAEQETELLELLERVCSASHARYWIVPIAKSGQLGQAIDSANHL